MSEVIIRRMTLNDVDGVHFIEENTFPNPWSRDAFVQEMTKNACARYLVAEESGKVIGFAGAWIVLDEAHVSNIAVLKDYRGQKIGENLTPALMQYAANLGVVYMTLEVRRSNLPAQALYHACGFIDVGYRKRYYEDNKEDALIMFREFSYEQQEEAFTEA